MPIDPTQPADNALISTLPAHIRQAKVEVQGIAVDVSSAVITAQVAVGEAQAAAALAQSYADSVRGIETAIIDGSGNLILTYTDTTTANIGNVEGPAGPQGPEGTVGPAGPQGAEGLSVVSGVVDGSNHLILTMSDTTTVDVGYVVGPQGPVGTDGDDGVDGRGIDSIVRTVGTGAPGTADTYTITFTDASTVTFQVYNGADGMGSGDMTKAVYDPNSDGIIAFAQLSGVAAALGSDDNYVTDAEKTKLSNLSGTNTGDQDLSVYSLTSHSHNLDNLAEKSYNSLTDKPSIPSISGLLDETAHDALDHIGLAGVLAIGTTETTACAGNDSRLSDSRTPTAHTTGSHSDWPADVSMTEVGYLDGVTSGIQGQLNAKGVGDVTLAGTQTLTNKTIEAASLTNGYTEEVYELTGTEINASNGSIQYKTLSGNTTFTEALVDGQSVTLMLNPATYTTTWPTATWIGSVASTAPTLVASVYNCITFFQIAGTLYGKYEGRV